MYDSLASARQADIYNNYLFLEELGFGAYGTVTKAQKKLGGGSLSYQTYAVKHIDKRKAGAKGLKGVFGEVETMMLLNHQNIVRLEETYQDQQNLWIVMEHMAGGELGKAIKQEGKLSEVFCKKVILYLLFALQYIHEKGFVHRDLKPSNCLLANPGEPMVKIADFGFAVLAGSDECLRSFCGTTAYMAPEILLGLNYGKPVDMWALGVMVFQMLSGDLPFVAHQGENIADLVADSRFNFAAPVWQNITPAAKDFICGLLEVDSGKRATAPECLEHQWLQSAMNGLDGHGKALSMRLGNDGAGSQSPDGKPKKLSPRSLFRGAGIAVLAAHRLLFWGKCRALRREGADLPILRSFPYLIGKHYRPPTKAIDCSGQFTGQTKALQTFLKMFESATTIETLDLSSNGIDSLDLAQLVVKSASKHPSLVNLHLDNNALPPLAGRPLLRLARDPSRIRSITLNNTPIPVDVIQQIQTALKEAERKREAAPSSAASPTASYNALSSGGTSNGHYSLSTTASGGHTPLPPAIPSSANGYPRTSHTPGQPTRSSSSNNLRWKPTGGAASATSRAAVSSSGPRLPPLPSVSTLTSNALIGRRK